MGFITTKYSFKLYRSYEKIKNRYSHGDHTYQARRIQNPFLTAQSTQMKSVISVPIKDVIHHYPRALFNDIPRVGAHFYYILGSGPILRHTQVGTHFYDIPGSGRCLTTYPGHKLEGK